METFFESKITPSPLDKFRRKVSNRSSVPRVFLSRRKRGSTIEYGESLNRDGRIASRINNYLVIVYTDQGFVRQN